MFRLTRKNRLNTPEDFRRVFSYGKKKQYAELTVIVCKSSDIMPRIGFAISKKQIKKAVDRNRFKRIAKEKFRLQQKELEGLDFIVLVKKTCQHVSNNQISQYFQELFIASAKLFDVSRLH